METGYEQALVLEGTHPPLPTPPCLVKGQREQAEGRAQLLPSAPKLPNPCSLTHGRFMNSTNDSETDKGHQDPGTSVPFLTGPER